MVVIKRTVNYYNNSLYTLAIPASVNLTTSRPFMSSQYLSQHKFHVTMLCNTDVGGINILVSFEDMDYCFGDLWSKVISHIYITWLV